MVLTGVADKEEGVGGAEKRVIMAMGPERSKHLHNFKMPTPWLTWGNQRFLRCMKVNNSTAGNANSASFDNHHHPHRSSRSFAASETDYPLGSKRNRDFDFGFGFGFEQRSPKNANSSARRLNMRNNRYIGADYEDEGIEAVREKLTFDLKTAADNMKFSILKEGDEDEDVEGEEPSAVAAEAAEAVERPWNLRTRRAACKAPIVNGKNSTKLEDRKAASVSPMRTENPMKSSRLRVVGGNGGEKKERAKFSVLLARKEIEEDYLEMIGERPPRRPKKRPKAVQKQMDTLFPGLWLTEVTPDMYKVDEFPESGKR